MTTATFTLPRKAVVLGGGESTAPLPVSPPVPLAPLEREIPARELLAREGYEEQRWYGQHRKQREPWSPWLKLAAYAVLVPLLFAVLAVLLSGCKVEGTTPQDPNGPTVEVSGDSPKSWIVPDGGAGDVC